MRSPNSGPDFGPVITSAIRVGDSLDGNGEQGSGFYMEDGGIPYLFSWAAEMGGSRISCRAGSTSAKGIFNIIWALTTTPISTRKSRT